MTNLEKLQLALEDELQIAEYYIEPGYTKEDEDLPILLANWNDVPDALHERLEEEGYALQWSDEWALNYSTNGIVRTMADSYHWTPSFVITDDGEMITIEDDIHEWLDWAICSDEAHPPRTVPRHFDLSTENFSRYNPPEPFETGWHPGQDADPRTVLEDIFKAFKGDVEVVFQIDEQSQFYTRWSAWYRENS